MRGIANETECKNDMKIIVNTVMGSNLPTVPEVTLGSHSSGSLTIPRCKIGDRPCLTLAIRVD